MVVGGGLDLLNNSGTMIRIKKHEMVSLIKALFSRHVMLRFRIEFNSPIDFSDTGSTTQTLRNRAPIINHQLETEPSSLATHWPKWRIPLLSPAYSYCRG